MCIVVYKPKNIDMPSEEILRECFDRNPDGAGYMFPEDGKVIIKKGFMNFKAFYASVMMDYDKKLPFVLHFRIQTQGGVNQECTHPFPISKNMIDLRQLDCECNFGLAHNGIIGLTSKSSYSTYYDYNSHQYRYDYKRPDYSDTMKFITDYLSLIIKKKDWYKDEDTLTLIEELAGHSNKFAIMDGDGHTTLIGNFIEDGGVMYSNGSYEPYIPKIKACDYIDPTMEYYYSDDYIDTTDRKCD